MSSEQPTRSVQPVTTVQTLRQAISSWFSSGRHRCAALYNMHYTLLGKGHVWPEYLELSTKLELKRHHKAFVKCSLAQLLVSIAQTWSVKDVFEMFVQALSITLE